MLLVSSYDKKIMDNLEGLENLKIFNLCSYKEGYDKLSALLPQNNINYTDEREFDEKYFEYIFKTEDMIFATFFDLVLRLYNNTHILLLVTKEPEYELIYESLLKLIQQRYGYVCHYINEDSDLFDIEDKSEFSISGLYNFDTDRKRYDDFMEELNFIDNSI